MNSYRLLLTEESQCKVIEFPRHSFLPLTHNSLWQIESGVVRTLTYSEDGAVVTLGLWGTGDIVGRIFSKADPYKIESLTTTKINLLPVKEGQDLTGMMIKHIQQMEQFLEIIRCPSVELSLLRLLTWLGNKFGNQVEQGKSIRVGLTHQEIAEILGTSRVTITRFLNNFEQQNIIQRFPHKVIVLKEEQAFWYYEI